MIDKKVAIVTGGARGIGLAISCQLAQDDYAVVVVGVREELAAQDGLDEIKKCGQPVLYVKADIAKDHDRCNVIDAANDNFGRIDLLVNNAGVAPKTRLDVLQTTTDSVDFVVDTNLKGTFFMTQLVSNYMINSLGEIDNHNFKIVNISSISSYVSSVNRAEYCLSKAGISMITSVFADRLAEYGINVYEIRPGVIATDMTATVTKKYDDLIQNGLLPIKRWGHPSDVSDAVSVICSGKLNYSTGEVINVDGGFHIRRL